MTDSRTFPVPGFSEFSEIGSGGFGTVYAATEDFFERPVAVKVLRQGLDASDRRRFERECRAMARLSDHPNVVTLYSAGYTEDERPFIVMELIAGGSLAERLKESGPLDWHQVQNIGVKMADALSRAHEVGVLHRDIKPANILMVGDEPKLTDFGIASFLDSTGATSANISVSWDHAPPETFEDIRDERSDLYSLGSTLHTLLTGAPPFSRAGESSINPLLNRLLNEEPPAIDRADVPQDLRTLILETLRKDPNDRPQTAGLVSQRLGEITQSRQMGAADTSGSDKTTEVALTTGTPSSGSATTKIGTTALPTSRSPSRPSLNAPASLGTTRRIPRWKVGTLAAVALFVGVAGAVSAEYLSRDQVADPTPGSEVAAPTTSEAPASSTTDDVTSRELTEPTESTAGSTTTEAAEPRQVTQPTESIADSITTIATPVATAGSAATSTQPAPQSTTASSTLPAPLSAPNVRLLEVTDSSLWVQWDPVESASWYPYRVTIDGEQVATVDNTSGIASYFGTLSGKTCIHVKAQNQAKTASSPEGTFCYDASTG